MLTANMECTESSLLREALLCHEATFRTLAEAITTGIFVSQGKGLHYVNHAAQTITGFTREELLRMSFWDFVHPDSRELVLEQDRVRQGDIIVHAQHEIKIFAKTGEERWLDIQTGVIEFDGALSTLISACDFTKHKRTEEQLQRLSVTDPLTGLGNYRRLIEALQAEVKRSGRTGQPFAILVFDLDRLKKINDCYGHSVGSQALRRLGDVLRINCRAIDTATRFGGDEFAVILPETSAAAASLVVSRIRGRLASDSQQPQISVSAGLAIYPKDGQTIEALLCAADRELYEMKDPNRGKALHHTF